MADRVAITEGSADGIVLDLAQTGYILKERVRRRNHRQIPADLPLPESSNGERAVGEVLARPGCELPPASDPPGRSGPDEPTSRHGV
jgi:hypothetical protein